MNVGKISYLMKCFHFLSLQSAEADVTYHSTWVYVPDRAHHQGVHGYGLGTYVRTVACMRRGGMGGWVASWTKTGKELWDP